MAGLLDGLSKEQQAGLLSGLAELYKGLEQNPAHPPERFNRGVRNVASGMARAAAEGIAFPRKYMETYQPGSMAADNPAATEWAAGTAMNMVGAPAMTGGVPGMGSGIRGTKSLPMDEASRMARAAEQGYTLDAYHGTKTPGFSEFTTGNIYDDAGGLLHGYSQHPNSLIGPHFAREPQIANKFAEGSGPEWLKSRYSETEAPAVYPVKLNASKVQKFRSEDDFDTLLFRQKADGPEIEDIISRQFDDIEEGFAKYDRDKNFREQVNREAVRNENNYDNPSTEIGQQLADAVRRQYEKAGVTAIQYPNAVEGGTSYVAIAPPRSRFAKFDPANKDSDNLLGSIAAALGGLLGTRALGGDQSQ
jgi:hypothetical protein